MKNIIDWFPKNDPFLKKGEIDIHEIIHEHKYQADDYVLNAKRLSQLAKAEKVIGSKISGNVLEVGAGDGSISVHLAQRDVVKKVYSMECNKPAVDHLIRRNFEKNGVSEQKYELVLGSFNDIKLKNYFDYAIALGVLHHSGNLIRTMKSIFSSLAPGGVLISQEPYMSSDTPNSVYYEKEKRLKTVQGIVTIKESERDDHFFRKCEYLTAFHHSGFEVKFIDIPELRRGDILNSLIILRKPTTEHSGVPHAWF